MTDDLELARETYRQLKRERDFLLKKENLPENKVEVPPQAPVVAGVAPISIKEVGSFCKARDLQAAVVITVSRDGTLSVVSFGETKKKCRAIGAWAQGLWKASITAMPFVDFFGWGHNGVPTPIPRNGLDADMCRKLDVFEEYLLNTPVLGEELCES